MTMSSPSESDVMSPTPGAFRLRWDVFLSFRGTDTRESFIKSLYDSLHAHGVRAFRDDDGLDRGDEIAPSLLEAIDDSAASIVIISSDYASSHWCLEELAKICECKRLVLPVFYRVDPSHVRKQLGPFEVGFRSHESRFKNQIEKVEKWREAMKKIGGVAGFVFNNNSDKDNLIQRLVQRVLKELSNTPMSVGEFTVGLDDRVEKALKLLKVESNGVKVLGLYGMGGVGKTTMAKALFNTIVDRFKHRCFISNVREFSSKSDGLVSLQSKLINDLSLGAVAPIITDVHHGISVIKGRVRENRVLIILDDVDDASHLDILIGKSKSNWFYEGSRIIITTRDREVLTKSHVNELYEVKELYSSEALELFSYHALRRKEPTQNFLNLSKQIVSLTGKLPLALEVFGSFLFSKRRVEEWEDALEKLKLIRPKHLQDVLKISYDGLDEQEKCIFLDIACLFVQMGMKRDELIDILRGCGFRAEIAISVLVEKCLIKITEDNTLWMHDQIRDMGRQIVLDENLVDPGMRSRLWNRAEIMTVIMDVKGTRCIQGIALDFEEHRFIKVKDESISSKSIQWKTSLGNLLSYINPSIKNYLLPQAEKNEEVILHTEAFEPMVSLRLLQINNLRMKGKFLPAELKCLQWRGCPLEYISLETWPRELAVLDLSNSKKLENFWGWKGYKVPENLMVLNLSYCIQLASIPDLSGCGHLEKIVLENCISLTRIHESFGSLITLRSLNLTRCSNLIELPSDVSGLKHLESLYLSGCLKLKALPENIGSLKSLKTLLADNTAIKEMPESIFGLTKLEQLILDGCQHLTRLPNCIGHLSSLEELSLNDSGLEELSNTIGSLKNLDRLSLMCKSLTVIPDSIGNLISLTELWVNRSAIRELPSSIGSLSYLRELSVGNCEFLSKLPDSIEALASLVELQLNGTAITYLPDQIGEMKLLRKLEMMNCSNLESLPESIGNLASLVTLNIFNGKIRELPESFGSLENLVNLRLNKCKMLRMLPASIGNLKSLYHFFMEETALSDLPESFGMLSSLRTLIMAKRPALVTYNNSILAEPEVLVSIHNLNYFVLPSSFCNLTMLIELDARAWNICGKIPDDFEKLSSLETLKLGQNNFHTLPSSLKGLSVLKNLQLPNCNELIFLPPLPSSLIELNVENCFALESIHDISNLESLQELKLTNCVKVMDIPGLESLKSLRRLYLSGCSACSSHVSKRLSKVALRNLQNLSMPGTRLPEWFSGQTVNFSKPKNLELKCVIVGVIISINHNINIPNIMRDHMPGVIDVEANVLKLGKRLYTTTLNIRGIPRTDEEHIHLCRYKDDHPLIAFLRDGDTFCVTKRDPPFDKGLELKKCGVHFIFEGDDDYDGEEESLDKGLQSVSEKLAEFFKISEGSSYMYTTDIEDECQKRLQTLEQEESRSSSHSYITLKKNSVIFFLISLFFVLLSLFCTRFTLSSVTKTLFQS
ncbi:PREDICTED: TMV resistance protein N [Lupinus angustifolius]|uniref:TMV resistance protein N n=1 Tax=Lupinus angustifolius TaxID=3871 RepID=UPI00092FA2C5|nr:PREDICTED: TMV resistance protein N [Lupinus angustifolius]